MEVRINSTRWITLPGLSEYNKTLQLMEDTVLGVINKSIANTIYLVEHEDVYTAGTNFTQAELLNPEDIPVVYTGRGGKFTYHGKGQRVIYPIIDLSNKKDVKLYIQTLEEWIINTLSVIGIKAYTAQGRIGIWVKDKDQEAKIAAIGVRIKKWVAYHGIAVNISTDIAKFSGIIPCGLGEFPVTSIANLGIDITMDQFDQVLQQEFKKSWLEKK